MNIITVTFGQFYGAFWAVFEGLSGSFTVTARGVFGELSGGFTGTFEQFLETFGQFMQTFKEVLR